MDGRGVNSCIILAAEADGSDVLTIEGLAEEGKPSTLQQAFLDKGAVQCGFCTPGMIMAAHYLLMNNPHPTEQEIKEGLSGNLCRCTGYGKIVEAVQAAVEAAK
jgi:carbon-monoxide dehydrogenase small subunit